jgi:hypothetical protein
MYVAPINANDIFVENFIQQIPRVRNSHKFKVVFIRFNNLRGDSLVFLFNVKGTKIYQNNFLSQLLII